MATRPDGGGLEPPVVLVHACDDLRAQQVGMLAAQHKRWHIRSRRHRFKGRPSNGGNICRFWCVTLNKHTFFTNLYLNRTRLT